MTNIIEAIINIINFNNFEIRDFYTGRNRANSVGDALEEFIKDSFANTFELDEQDRIKIFSNKFSWLGNQNHPPDLMIKKGGAIEVKKTQSSKSDLALNSSFPKSRIYSDSKMITQECRSCEDWLEKDLIYCVGHTTDSTLHSLWLIYGNIYAANHAIYERIKDKISSGVNSIPNVEFSETKELGRVNKVDPLGITNLRIRGMWQIQNPRKVFEKFYETNQSNLFELISIIPKEKFDKFDTTKLFELKNENLYIEDIQTQNPNNPAQLIDCKLIKYVLDV